MKQLLLFIFISSCLWAQLPPTPNLGLTNPAPHANYSADWYGNFATIDNIFGIPDCGDSGHAVGWSLSAKKLTCQAIAGGSPVLLAPTNDQTITGGFNFTVNSNFQVDGSGNLLIGGISLNEATNDGHFGAISIGASISNCGSAGSICWMQGAGSPEGVVTAHVGSIYSDSNALGKIYYKSNGVSNTGWLALSTGTVPGGSNTQVQFNDSAAFGGDSGFTYNKSTDTANVGYMATATGPQINPRAPPYNCANNGSTDDTTCFQAAVTYMEGHPGSSLICSGSYKLGRIQLAGVDWIEGTGDNNGAGCTITIVTDAAFVTGVPSQFLAGVTIKNIKFIGGTSPIDFGQANDVHVENVQFFNNTNCGVVWVYGERGSMIDLTGVHTGNNGFATLCTGDKTNSLFAGSISVAGAPARSYFRGINELGGLNGGTNFAQYVWWGGQGVGGGLTTSHAYDILCFYSCTTGVIWMDVMTMSSISGIDLDHVGKSGAHETIAVNIALGMEASRIDQYYPAFNTNYADVQLAVGPFSESTLANMQFCNACNNTTTFGLKLTSANTNTGVLDGVRGTIFSSNLFSGPSIIGGQLDVTNTLGGQQFIDNTNAGFYWNVYNQGLASTGPYKFCRMAGGFTNVCDFTSNGTVLTVNEYIRTPPVAFSTLPACAAGTEGAQRAVSDSSTATWGATITGSSTNHVLAYCDGTNWTVAAK